VGLKVHITREFSQGFLIVVYLFGFV